VPIYDLKCRDCGKEAERLLSINEELPVCCGVPMQKKPTFPCMVIMDGMGGYPSRRKYCTGTAPFTSNNTRVWDKNNAVPFESKKDES
jgi:predicted nucleic acid-binding Zn ribbon protein